MSDWVAIAGIVGSAGVGVAGLVFGYLTSRSHQAVEHQKADQADLRAVLDFAAEQIEVTMRRGNAVHRAWKQTETNKANVELVVDRGAVESFLASLDGPAVARGRLAMRVLGDDKTNLVGRYLAALDATDLYRRVLMGYEHGERYDGAETTKAHLNLRCAIDDFYVAANARIGVDRPADETAAGLG